MRIIHALKCSREEYEATVSGKKTHEFRSALDHEYVEGDELRLREYDYDEKKFTGREISVIITYASHVHESNTCAMSIRLKTTADLARLPDMWHLNAVSVYAAVSPQYAQSYYPLVVTSLDNLSQDSFPVSGPFPEHLVRRYGEDAVEHDFSLKNDPLYSAVIYEVREREEVLRNAVHKGEHFLNVSSPERVSHLARKIVNAFEAEIVTRRELITFIQLFGKCKTVSIETQMYLLEFSLSTEIAAIVFAILFAVDTWYEGAEIDDSLVDIIKIHAETGGCDYDVLKNFLAKRNA